MMTQVINESLRLAQGKVKSFGVFGPKYEVGNPVRQLEDGDWMMHIKLLESGEETEYRFSHLENDPEAH